MQKRKSEIKKRHYYSLDINSERNETSQSYLHLCEAREEEAKKVIKMLFVVLGGFMRVLEHHILL